MAKPFLSALNLLKLTFFGLHVDLVEFKHLFWFLPISWINIPLEEDVSVNRVNVRFKGTPLSLLSNGHFLVLVHS